MSEVKIPMNLPLDTDGFLRRECPYCKRAFKIVPSDKGEEEEEEKHVTVELFCPYCGQSADKNSWWTGEQFRYAKEIAVKKVLEPELEKLGVNLERTSKRSFITVKMEKPSFKTPRISEEADDMRIFKLRCCNESIKIEEDWKGDIHCTICGTRSKFTQID